MARLIVQHPVENAAASTTPPASGPAAAVAADAAGTAAPAAIPPPKAHELLYTGKSKPNVAALVPSLSYQF